MEFYKNAQKSHSINELTSSNHCKANFCSDTRKKSSVSESMLERSSESHNDHDLELISLDNACRSFFCRSHEVRKVDPTVAKLLDEGHEPPWKLCINYFSAFKKNDSSMENMKKNIRDFYTRQNDIIETFELAEKESSIREARMDEIYSLQKTARNLASLTLLVNIMLVGCKTVASALTASISVISSLLDSVVDIISGLLIWWASKAIKQRKPYMYPQGRTRLEPLAILVLSVVMLTACFIIIKEAFQRIMKLAQDEATGLDMSPTSIALLLLTIVAKILLYLVSRKYRSNASVRALVNDHRNDIFSNSIALAAGLIADHRILIGTYFVPQCQMINLNNSKFLVTVPPNTHDTSPSFSTQYIHVISSPAVAYNCTLDCVCPLDNPPSSIWAYADPVGAILITIYIAVSWGLTGWEHTKNLAGLTAPPNFLQKITWITLNHDKHIRKIDTVRAFHFGNNFLVEVDIVLPEDMALRTAHDIGETLQQKLEALPEVERAFVHLDYEWEHNPNNEHRLAI